MTVSFPQRVSWIVALCTITSVSACTSDSTQEPAEQHDPLALRRVNDKNPANDVVEFDLEAREMEKIYSNGVSTKVWTYNGTVPGPLVDANVGDRILVHFRNSLPEPTTIHWHGIRLPAAMDGSLAVQQPIPPGGTFEYSFTLKDAGLFWFHPHIRSDIQVQKGLYGVIRARGPDEPTADREEILVLDDIKLNSDGAISEFLDDTSKMMGREGKTLLVNGTPNAATRPVRPGSLVRYRIVNVANGRFFNLRLPGHRWRVIGVDGGLVPRPFDTETLLVAPGERYDVMVVLRGESGASLTVMNEPYERGHDSGKAAPMRAFDIQLSSNNPSAPAARALPAQFADLERLPARPADFPIELDEVVQGDDVIFTINGKAHAEVPPIRLQRGDVRALHVRNKSEMDHPFHLHGFFFQVLERNGIAEEIDRLANKDTIIVPAMSSLLLVSRFDEPGKWMYHCHILEHGEHGMMGEIEIR